MPNKMLNQSYPNKTHHNANSATNKTNSVKRNDSNDTRENKSKHDDVSNNAKHRLSIQESNQAQQETQQTNILNVAEMLLHGVADNEILTIWLQSISCQEFTSNFLNAGYDMPTISRITPQDLTAIGITDPSKRLKILSEIKKLNLQDGIPAFRPANLNHWLSLLRLDSQYFELLCDQQIDTIDKVCQLTWEDFEELGITKLGHQKRLTLAIERMKEIDSKEAKSASKPMSEPIYDTNPSQILLVASAENHCMNGPIINKQSSTSELSSTGSGSMHSVYSANSMHYQPTYATLSSVQQHPDQNHNVQHKSQHQAQNQHHQQQQVIYSQPPSQIIHQVPHPHPPIHQTQTPLIPATPFNQQNQSSHYQATQPITSNPSQLINTIYDTSNLNKRNTMVPQSNRQSLSNQLPFSALANLPKHQQQLLQQSSIYATLGRQPQRAKQPPPPVPIRTNSLKSNSLVDEETSKQQTSHNLSSQTMSNSQIDLMNSLFRSGTRVSNKVQMNSQTLLTKNKSFSGNAYMDAARARFLNRNNFYQQPQSNPISTNHNNQNGAHEFIYGVDPSFNRFYPTNGHPTIDSDNMSLYSHQSFATTGATDRSNAFNPCPSDIQAINPHRQQRYPDSMSASSHTSGGAAASNQTVSNGDEFDPQSDANSTKSLILQPTSVTNSPISNNRQMSLSQDSGSSQTLYNSASSGSNDRNLNGCNLSQSGDLASRHSIASNSTLSDVNLILDQTVIQRQDNLTGKNKQLANLRNECNATTGKDDDFPPPPSPLSLTDSDENDLLSLNSDKNFADINNRLMAFRVGI
jgi:hypothetical protein